MDDGGQRPHGVCHVVGPVREGQQRGRNHQRQAEKDLERNALMAGPANQRPLLYGRGLYTWSIDWVDGVPELPLRCVAKTRYRQPDQSCILEPAGNGYRVLFDEPQRAVTPGQSVVFYRGEVCLGGGVIERTFMDKAGSPGESIRMQGQTA